jgi:hypothetical protein
MAIPTTFFANKAGIAIMHYDPVAGEWFFRGWATKRGIVLDCGAGNHIIQLWLVNGASSGFGSVSYTGTASIAVLNAKR